MIHPKTLPLHAGIQLEATLNLMRTEVEKNDDILRIQDSPLLISIYDKEPSATPGGTFFFNIKSVIPQGNQVLFEISYKPQNAISIEEHNIQVSSDSTVGIFNNWIQHIKKYNAINLSNEKNFSKIYANEIFADFELIEDDEKMYTEPLPSDAQLQLFTIYRNFISVAQLKPDFDKNEELQIIVEEMQEAAEQIPNQTRHQAVKKFSKIMGKLKTISYNSFIEFYDVAKKELYKKVFSISLDGGVQFVNDVVGLIHKHH